MFGRMNEKDKYERINREKGNEKSSGEENLADRVVVVGRHRRDLDILLLMEKSTAGRDSL